MISLSVVYYHSNRQLHMTVIVPYSQVPVEMIVPSRPGMYVDIFQFMHSLVGVGAAVYIYRAYLYL